MKERELNVTKLASMVHRPYITVLKALQRHGLVVKAVRVAKTVTKTKKVTKATAQTTANA